MKFTLWLIVIFITAVLIGLLYKLNVGYAILYMPPYRIDLSINSLVLATLAIFVVLYFLVRLFVRASAIPREVRRFQKARKSKAAHMALCKAGIAYFEGRLQQTEREANKALYPANGTESNALALLLATSASGGMLNVEKRSHYLSKLDTMPKKVQLARHILEAEQRLEAHDTAESLAAIERARAISPNLTRALRIELRIRLLQKQPDEALRLTEKLFKSKTITAEQATRYRLAAQRQKLATLTSTSEVNTWFKRLPDAERKNTDLLDGAFTQLIMLDEADAASLMLSHALRDPEIATPALAHKLGQIAVLLSPDRRLAALHEAEQWLKNRPEDAELLLSLGRMALAQQLWGKAQNYLEASLSINPSLLLAHAELAKLYEATGKPELAEKARNSSLTLALEQAN